MASKQKKTSGRPAETRDKDDDSTMADFARRFKANPFVFVGTFFILIIIVIAFVFLPAIAPEIGRSMDLTFGSYNRIPITYAEGNYFFRVQQNLARQAQSSMDEANYQFALFRIWREAFEATVVHIGILDEMKNAGYTVPDDAVDRAMAMLPDFQVNGAFSPTRFRQMDNNRRMVLWRQIRDSIAVDYYVSDLSGLRVSPGESSFISAMASPQRNFELVSFPINTYPDSEIVAYVQANPDMFRVTHLSRITATSEREARLINTNIRNGTETFEDAARNRSSDFFAENAGDMGSRMAFELQFEIPDAQVLEELMSLERGAISEVKRLGDNWVIFRAEDRVRPADTSNPIEMNMIRDYVFTYERGRAEDWLIEQAEEFIADARTRDFSSAAEDRGLLVRAFGPLPVNFGNVVLFPSVAASGLSELSNVESNEFFWRAAFSTPLNTPSVPVVLGANVVVFYPLEEIEAAEDDVELIDMFYSYWLSSSADQDFRSFFLNNEKLDDRFWDVFQHFLW